MEDCKYHYLEAGNQYNEIMPQLCCIMVDTSISMAEERNAVSHCLSTIRNEIRKSAELQRVLVEISVITFNNTARIATPFTPVYDFRIPDLSYQGSNNMHAAIDFTLNIIKERIKLFRESGICYFNFKPIILLLTNGWADDKDNGAFLRLREAQDKGGRLCFPIIIGENVNMDLLEYLNINNIVLSSDSKGINELYGWIKGEWDSHPSSFVSANYPDFPNPAEYCLTVHT